MECEGSMRKRYYAIVNCGTVRMQHAKSGDEAERLAFGCRLPSTKVYDLGTSKVKAYEQLNEMGLGEK
jgi:hypothetical protein